jgi:hypothetical protein
MQLAYHHGFERVGLVGVDHSYVFEGNPDQLLTSEGDDPNHFHPDYFGKGVRWQAPNLAESETHYRLARQAFEENGGEIVNITPDSKLSVFRREDWKQW